ncbi:hypothetical protein DTC83_06595 [Salmonella enterica]|nr:hypothetical protein [Salmonella enterica]EEM8546718.1 hypothetical protein [Salmonella enterica]
MTFKKWLVLLIFLITAFVFTMNVVVCAIYITAKLYLYIVRNIPVDTYLPGLLRLVKGASFGGVIGGIGCWFIYFKNEKL